MCRGSPSVFETVFRNGQYTSTFRTDLQTDVLAAQAQELHEHYLAGDTVDDEDPDVDDPAARVDTFSPCEHSSTTSAGSTSTVTSTCRRVAGTDMKTDTSHGLPENSERRVARTKLFSKRKKRDQRVLEGPGQRYSPYVGRSTKTSAKKKKQRAEAIHTDFRWTSSVADHHNRVAKSALVGVRLKPGDFPVEPETKAESLQRGLDEIKWDGEYVCRLPTT